MCDPRSSWFVTLSYRRRAVERSGSTGPTTLSHLALRAGSSTTMMAGNEPARVNNFWHFQQACIQMQVHLHLQVQMRHLHLHLHLNAPRWAHLHLHLHLNRRHLHLHLHLIQMHLIGFKCHSNANQMRLECNIINYLHKIDAIHRN